MFAKRYLLIASVLFSAPLYADRFNEDLVVDSAVGGAVGGALGGAVGAVVGGRDGAIIGSGIGAAAGTAINTDQHRENTRNSHHKLSTYQYNSHPGRFCPPGQAKKGRC